ncbi:MAG TPA: AAA family ATPase [Verrucomicrobiales bacterium]|nr:AAA family ATPase [Verrucomicrobiales bacterium]
MQDVAPLHRLRDNIASVYMGNLQAVDRLVVCLLARGHVLIEDVPGVGKTVLANALARSLDCTFSRVQCTPDLLPSDITGVSIYHREREAFEFKKGPVFANVVLADEINRAPAKTQASLLEVMQERQVTIDGESISLSAPFMTLATQNPVEHEGTYPLPEAQLDRFLMKILIDYPGLQDEAQIVAMAAGTQQSASLASLRVVCSVDDIVRAQEQTAQVQAVPEVVNYCVALVRATRESRAVSLGAGTRGAISLLRVGKAIALMHGRNYVVPDDIKAVSLPVLRHRVQLTPEVAITGQEVDEILRGIIESVPAPRMQA